MKINNQALQFAMKLIGLRRRSSFEIVKKLKRKNFDSNVIEKTLEKLKEYKYLDDEKFAESYINDRINFRPCGKFLIKKELKERGITENIIERKIEELFNEKIEIESAKKLAQKKMKILSDKTDQSKINQKLKTFLQSKGYSFDIISQVVKNEIIYKNSHT